MSAVLLRQKELKLITARSMKFPQGNQAAFKALESRLSSLKGRKFYGLVYERDGGIEYYAGLLPLNGEEENEFERKGFSIKRVNSGLWVREKLFDWPKHTEQIAAIMDKMIETYGIDTSRPQLEYYRSLTELHLLVPIQEKPHDMENHTGHVI